MGKKFLYKTTTNTITRSDGTETTQETKELIQLEAEPFYIVYVKYIKWIYGINSGKTLLLLMKILEMMEFNTGIVDLSRSVRQKLMIELELSQSSLSQCINRLVEKEAIYKRKIANESTGELIELRGSYIVNPLMFWKGTLKGRRAVKVQFTTIENEFSEQDMINNGYSLVNIEDHEEEDN